MFRGINAVNLDTKGRIAIPKRYRERLLEENKGQMVVTIDTEVTCLLLYPLAEWEVIEEKIQALPSFNPAARRIQRLLIGHATELEIDNNGRILLPDLLRKYGKFDKKVMVVGQGKKFELWDELTWHSHCEKWLVEAATQEKEELPEDLQSISL